MATLREGRERKGEEGRGREREVTQEGMGGYFEGGTRGREKREGGKREEDGWLKEQVT